MRKTDRQTLTDFITYACEQLKKADFIATVKAFPIAENCRLDSELTEDVNCITDADIKHKAVALATIEYIEKNTKHCCILSDNGSDRYYISIWNKDSRRRDISIYTNKINVNNKSVHADIIKALEEHYNSIGKLNSRREYVRLTADEKVNIISSILLDSKTTVTVTVTAKAE